MSKASSVITGGSGFFVTMALVALTVLSTGALAQKKPFEPNLVRGEWLDDSGIRWRVEVEDVTGLPPTAKSPPYINPNVAITAKQKEIDKLTADTRHYWRNGDTGEIMKQAKDKLHNPGLPFYYAGEAPNDLERIKALRDEIAALQSASGGVPQPPAFRNPSNGQRASVIATLPDGHVVMFKEGWYDGYAIQARRRITDATDIPTDVADQKIREQIASKWQPWQWLDLKVIQQEAGGDTNLAGEFWSSPFVANDAGTVTRIDPAESLTLNLFREKTNKECPTAATEGDNKVAIRYLQGVDGKLVAVDQLHVRELFRIEVCYSRSPSPAPAAVEAKLPGGSGLVFALKPQTDPVRFRTDALYVTGLTESEARLTAMPEKLLLPIASKSKGAVEDKPRKDANQGSIDLAKDQAKNPDQLARQKPSDGFAWLEGDWRVAYSDKALGEVTGTAKAKRAVSGARMPLDIDLTFVDPRRKTSEIVQLSNFAKEGSKLKLSFLGKSPASGYLGLEEPWGRDLKPAKALNVAEWELLRAKVEGAENAIPVKPSGFLVRVVDLALTVPENSADRVRLEGEWSYEPVRPSDMRLSRAGKFESGSVKGREVWQRGGPEIEAVTALDMPDPSDRAKSKAAIAKLPKDHGEDTLALVWLRIDGKSLPFQPDRDVTVKFEDPRVSWTGKRRPSSHMNKPESLEIEVLLKTGIVSNAKKFTLNDAPGTWALDRPDMQPRVIRFVRRIPYENGSAREYEPTESLFAGEIFYLEAEYEKTPNGEVRRAGIRAAGADVQDVELKQISPGSPIFRSPRILLLDPSDPEPASKDFDSSALAGVPSTIVRAKAGEKITASDTTEVGIEGKNRVIGSIPVEKPTDLWRDAMSMAINCRNSGQSETEFSNFVLWSSRHRQTVEVKAEDHAAMILLKDELIEDLNGFIPLLQQARSATPVPAGATHAQRNAIAKQESARTKQVGEALALALSKLASKGGRNPLFDMPVRTPDAIAMGSGHDATVSQIKLNEVLNRNGGYFYLDNWQYGSEQDFLDYARQVIAEAQGKLLGYATDARDRAANTRNCDVRGLLRLVGFGMEPVAARLMPKLVRQPKGDEPPLPRIVQDTLARQRVRELYVLNETIEAQEAYAELDKSMSALLVTAAVAVVAAAPAMAYAAGAGATATAAAGVAGTLGTGTMLGMFAQDLSVLYGETQAYQAAARDTEFAMGATAVAGNSLLERNRQLEAAAFDKAASHAWTAGAMTVGGAALSEAAAGFRPKVSGGANLSARAEAVEAPKAGTPDAVKGGSGSKVESPVVQDKTYVGDTSVDLPKLEKNTGSKPIATESDIDSAGWSAAKRKALDEAVSRAQKLGVDPEVAQRNAIVSVAKGLDSEAVDMGVARANGIPPEKAMQGMSQAEARAALDRYLKVAEGATDDVRRAKAVDDYFGGKSIDQNKLSDPAKIKEAHDLIGDAKAHAEAKAANPEEALHGLLDEVETERAQSGNSASQSSGQGEPSSAGPNDITRDVPATSPSADTKTLNSVPGAPEVPQGKPGDVEGAGKPASRSIDNSVSNPPSTQTAASGQQFTHNLNGEGPGTEGTTALLPDKPSSPSQGAAAVDLGAAPAGRSEASKPVMVPVGAAEEGLTPTQGSSQKGSGGGNAGGANTGAGEGSQNVKGDRSRQPSQPPGSDDIARDVPAAGPSADSPSADTKTPNSIPDTPEVPKANAQKSANANPYGVKGLDRFTSGDLAGEKGEAAVIRNSKSFIPERNATLGKVIEEYYQGQKMPPMHTTNLAELRDIGASGMLRAPDQGASFSYLGSGTLRDGNIAIRIKPGFEGNVQFIPDPNGTGLRPLHKPTGKPDIPIAELQYFQPGRSAAEARWVDFPPRSQPPAGPLPEFTPGSE